MPNLNLYTEIVNGCSSPRITRCEREILKTINWNYENYPTFYSVAEAFRSQGVIFDSDRVVNPHFQVQELPSYNTVLLVDKYIEFYSLLVLQDSSFVNLNPYLITCAILSASRRSASLLPLWPQELVQLSGLQINHFCNVTDSILNLYKSTFEKKSETHSSQINKESNMMGGNASSEKSQ